MGGYGQGVCYVDGLRWNHHVARFAGPLLRTGSRNPGCLRNSFCGMKTSQKAWTSCIQIMIHPSLQGLSVLQAETWIGRLLSLPKDLAERSNALEPAS